MNVLLIFYIKVPSRKSVVKQLLIVLFLLPQVILAQKKQFREYLKVSSNEWTERFEFDSSFYENRLFIFTEAHGYKENYEFSSWLVKKMVERKKLKWILLEKSFSSAYYINRYLASGSESELLKSYDFAKGTFGWNQEDFDFWRAVYKINNNLDTRDRITVLGMDIEHQWRNAFILLDKITSIDRRPLVLDSLQFYGQETASYAKMKIFLTKILKYIRAESDYLKVLYSDEDLFVINHLIQNISNRIYCYSAKRWNQTRDSVMHRNISKLLSRLELKNEDSFLSIVGDQHGYQDVAGNTHWVGARLAQDNLFKNRTVTINAFYFKGKRMFPYSLLPKPIAIFKRKALYTHIRFTNDNRLLYRKLSHFQGGQLISRFQKNSATLIKLDKARSPYSRRNKFNLIKYPPVEQVATTRYFQYAIVFKHPNPTKPLSSLN